jgi:uncharacterized protein YbjQ (UPF0145 family)
MRWPGQSSGGEDAQARERRERSLVQLEAGGLPVAAEERLRGLAAGPAGLFTSDLSVNEFALLRRHGVRPLTQVMGTSIFQPGWQNLPYDTWYGYRRGQSGGMLGGGLGLGGRRNWGSDGSGRAWSAELTSISDAYNQARERALQRLRQEAQLAQADAVVAVRVRRAGRDLGSGEEIEFTAVGTAVRLPDALRTRNVVVTDLSGQDYVQLATTGARPVGVVGVSTVMYVASSVDQSWILSSGNSFFSVAGRANQELPDFTRGFYDAREVAIGHLSAQARALGAHGIVGVSIDQHIREREYDDAGENRHHDLIVFVHLLGTAITEGHAPLAAADPLTILPVTPARGL